jgi:hypothetical protein
MPKKTKRELELELEIARMQGKVEGVQSVATPRVAGAKTVVGIRNISNYTVGIMNKIQGEQGEVSLHAERFGQYDPMYCAVISETFWKTLRKGPLVGKGIIMRDDSVCSPGDVTAEPDRDVDLAPGREHNAIVDPFQWIDSRNEDELRDAVSKIVSEFTLHRLAAAINHKIWSIGEEKYKDHEERAKFAIRDTPSKYLWLDKLVEERLDELNPNSKERAEERNFTAKFRS